MPMTETPLLPPLVEDLTLTYRSRAPREADQGLIILLHGVGSNESSMAGLAALLPERYAIALVRSPIPMGSNAFCAFPVNFTPNGPVIDQAAAEASRRKLVKFVAELQARTGLSSRRTLIAGFSQGGIMSASLALTSPESVAGFGILSGRILPEIAPLIAHRDALAKLDALILHGELDSTLPIGWAERSSALLRDLGVPFEAHFYPARHEITEAMASDFIHWVEKKLPCPSL